MADRKLVRNFDSVLTIEARACLDRAKVGAAEGNSVVSAGAAFSAIVAAAGAVETYLSELLAHLEDKELITADVRAEIRRLEGLWAKYNRLAAKFGSSEFYKEPLYNRLQALIHLRNCMIHRSAEYRAANDWPEEVASYKSVIPHEKGNELDWTSQVFSVPTAEWAVKTSWDFLVMVDNHIPDPSRLPFIDPGADA
jgi:hypothetical protein